MADDPFAFIYIIGYSDSDGPIKVGFSANPSRRLADLQTSHHSKLEVRFAKKVDLFRGNEVEKKVHAALHEYRLSGEWFSAPFDVASNAIEQISELVEKQRVADERRAKIRDKERKNTTPPGSPIIQVPDVELVHKVTVDEKIALDRYLERQREEKRAREVAAEAERWRQEQEPFRRRMIEGKKKKAAERLALAAAEDAKVAQDMATLQKWLAKGASS